MFFMEKTFINSKHGNFKHMNLVIFKTSCLSYNKEILMTQMIHKTKKINYAQV